MYRSFRSVFLSDPDMRREIMYGWMSGGWCKKLQRITKYYNNWWQNSTEGKVKEERERDDHLFRGKNKRRKNSFEKHSFRQMNKITLLLLLLSSSYFIPPLRVTSILPPLDTNADCSFVSPLITNSPIFSFLSYPSKQPWCASWSSHLMEWFFFSSSTHCFLRST